MRRCCVQQQVLAVSRNKWLRGVDMFLVVDDIGDDGQHKVSWKEGMAMRECEVRLG